MKIGKKLSHARARARAPERERENRIKIKSALNFSRKIREISEKNYEPHIITALIMTYKIVKSVREREREDNSEKERRGGGKRRVRRTRHIF